jgi:hypothetical protein
MPNWTECELKVSGNKEQLEAFKKKGFKAEVYIPYEGIDKAREEFLALSEEEKKMWYTPLERSEEEAVFMYWFNEHDGYNWCVNNWGTKWDWNVDCINNSGPRSVGLSFQTAWAPPCPVVVAASREFPDLNFTLNFWECGMGFKGTFKCKAGEVLLDRTEKYHGSRGG